MADRDALQLGFRLEDVVALVFFSIDLFLQVFFRELRGQPINPSGVLIIVPAMCLLLAKEVANHFIAGRDPNAPGDRLGLIRPYWEIFRDWFPFLVILLMYYSLWGKATLLLVPHDRDALLLAWDKRLFGVEPSVWMQRFVSRPLTAWMQFAYAFHLYMLPIVGCFVYVYRRRDRFREMMCGLVLITFAGIVGYLLIPAVGPAYTLGKAFTVPLTQPLAVFNQPIAFMNFARIQRDCFPSLHIGISFLIWLYAYRNSKALFGLLTPFILSLWISTVYLRYHYAVDCLAGLALAPACYWAANWLYRRCGDVIVRVPLPVGWAERIRRIGQPGAAATDGGERL